MEQAWWKDAVVYQIYPKSFKDSNGDGTGDIAGIIEKLDYLEALGVNVLWICPVYCSPMDDNGYDISDYDHVDPSFGTDEDLDRLIEEAGKRGMKLLMDLVVNHTSDEHPWFQEALHNPDSPYADYYVFREGKNGMPPDNLRSYFGGSVWEQVGETNRYYLHSFGIKQPDLNWDHKELREEIYGMMNRWLDKGLGGFRVDAIGNIKKDLTKAYYEPDGEDGLSHVMNGVFNKPGIEVFLQEMKERTLKPHNSMTVAEISVPDEQLPLFAGEDGFFSMVFDFSYTDIDVPETGEWYKPNPWTVKDLRNNIFKSQLDTLKIGWGAVYLENHDQPRSLNKYIPEEDISYYSATMLACLYLMLRGTPFIYQGQELGMTNIRMDQLEDYDDIATYDQFERALQSGYTKEEAWDAAYRRSRDNSRTPMQWDNSRNAGFTAGEHTWLKVNGNYSAVNAKREEEARQSVLQFYRKLIALRRSEDYQDVIVNGSFVPYETESDTLIAYKREKGGREILVLNHFSAAGQEVKLPEGTYGLLLSNYDDEMAEGGIGEEEDGRPEGTRHLRSVRDRYDCRAYESVVLVRDIGSYL